MLHQLSPTHLQLGTHCSSESSMLQLLTITSSLIRFDSFAIGSEEEVNISIRENANRMLRNFIIVILIFVNMYDNLNER